MGRKAIQRYENSGAVLYHVKAGHSGLILTHIGHDYELKAVTEAKCQSRTKYHWISGDSSEKNTLPSTHDPLTIQRIDVREKI